MLVILLIGEPASVRQLADFGEAMEVRKMMNFGKYGDWGGSWGMMRSGGDWGVVGGYMPGLYLILHLITWFLLICILAALLRWLWKKGGGK